MAGAVPVDDLADCKAPLGILLVPILNLKIVHTLEVLHPTPAHPHPDNNNSHDKSILIGWG